MMCGEYHPDITVIENEIGHQGLIGLHGVPRVDSRSREYLLMPQEVVRDHLHILAEVSQLRHCREITTIEKGQGT